MNEWIQHGQGVFRGGVVGDLIAMTPAVVVGDVWSGRENWALGRSLKQSFRIWMRYTRTTRMKSSNRSSNFWHMVYIVVLVRIEMGGGTVLYGSCDLQ